MKKNFKAVLSSALLIAGTLGLTVGATTALFTSDARADVNVVAGKVNVSMSIENLKTYSGKYNENSKAYDVVETAVAGKFTNGGTAKIENGVLSLDKISPMDKVEFDVKFTNASNINIQYRTVKEVIENSGLFEGLEVKIDDNEFEMTEYSDWEAKETGGVINGYHVSVTLPEEAGNEYQEKACQIKFGIEAVQGNAHVENAPEDADLGIYNANDLMIYGRGVEAGNGKYTYKTAVLMNDIDMAGLEWSPVNVWSKGITFDGLEHTISNLKIKDGYHGSGFFTGGNGLLMKNVKFDNASVTGIGQVGIAVGNGDCARLENITVTNSTVKAVVTNNDDGDKAGAIVGYLCYDGGTAYLKNSKVEGCTVEGYRDVGGAVGIANGACVVENVDVKNTVITCNKTNNYKNYTTDEQFDIHEVIGETTASAVVTNTTYNNVTFKEIKPAEIIGHKAQLTEFDAGSTAVLPEGTMTMSNVPNNIDIKGQRDEEGNIETVIDATGSGSIASVPNGATFEDLILEAGQSNYHGFQHAGLITFKGCTIKGLLFSYGDMVFEDCLFEQSAADYNMWAYGEDLTFKNCTFKSYGKFINVYNEGDGEYTVSFDTCKFINLKDSANKCAVNVKETCGSTLLKNRTIIKNCTTEGLFPATSGIPATDNTCIYYNSLVMIDDRTTNGAGLVKVTYNDQVIYENGVLK